MALWRNTGSACVVDVDVETRGHWPFIWFYHVGWNKDILPFIDIIAFSED